MVRLKMSMDENRKEGAYFRNITVESVMVRLRSEKKSPNLFVLLTEGLHFHILQLQGKLSKCNPIFIKGV